MCVCVFVCASSHRRMTLCGSIISRKSDNWFVNAFAASMPRTHYVIFDSEMWKRSLSMIIIGAAGVFRRRPNKDLRGIIEGGPFEIILS